MRISPILPLIVLSLGASLGRAQTAPSPEAKPRRNVLFLICDDLNADLGCYGHPLVKSPNVDRIAARGVRFERTYCQYPLCNPSRSSFLTGRYPLQTGVLDNSVRFRSRIPDVVTLPQYFRNHGYFVARVGKLYHYGVPGEIGTDGLDDPPSWEAKANPRGLDCAEPKKIHCILPNGPLGSTLSWLNLPSRDEEQTDGIGATETIRFLEANHPKKTGKPFFIAFGCYRPHTPYVAPSKYFDLYPVGKIQPALEKPGDRDDIPPVAVEDKPGQRDLPLEKRKEIIQAYFASISYADAQIGRVLDALERLGLADDTVVLFTSDHGYLLGEHGLWQKQHLFEPTVKVPLVIAEPGSAQAGKSTAALAEMVDLYPTLAELCGLPAPEGASGRSLAPVLKDPSKPHLDAALTLIRRPPPAPEATGDGKAAGKRRIRRKAGGEPIPGATIRTARYRYTEWGEDGEDGVELYDEEKDPDELTNLAKDGKAEEAIKGLRKLLQQKVADANKPESPPSPAPDEGPAWGGKGADPVLFLRPALRERAGRELARSGASSIPALVAAIERLRPLTAAHPGSSRKGSPPWEPAEVYEPTDDELLLSLAGDRVWRTTQIAPPDVVSDVRKSHPELPAAFEYPHIEITRVDVAGTGPRYVAAPPQTRRVSLGEAPR